MEKSVCAIPREQIDSDGDGRWMSQHNHIVNQCKDKEPEVVFIGDTVIQELQQRPTWNDLFEPLHSINCGVGFDTTQNVIWRLRNGILDNINPKVVVVSVGGYNREPVEDVVAGIVQIFNDIREKHPSAHIIFLELLPRGEHPDNPYRKRYDQINHGVKKACSGLSYNVEIVPWDKSLLQSNGTISHHDMLDYLRPTEVGARKAFEPVHELILQLLNENEDFPEVVAE